MNAVHFGAGNIGRGFIGCVLQNAGYRVTFVDVNDDLVSALNAHDSYRVIETGPGATTHILRNFDALNSRTEQDSVIRAISEADVVTASVGPTVLPHIAAVIAAGIDARVRSTPVIVMACENAINATDTLAGYIAEHGTTDASRVAYANTAVDRIVPIQNHGDSLDVTVEAFSEWAIDSRNIAHLISEFPGSHFVNDLSPYIERKLFTVNTAHATIAYIGQRHGARTISEALAMPEVASVATAVLAETSRVLCERHGFDDRAHAEYVATTLSRFRNPDLDDTVERVGRQPLRKLSRTERLVAPAAYLAELGETPRALLTAIGAALNFTNDDDQDVAKITRMLESSTPEHFALEVCGITPSHPLYLDLVATIRHSAHARGLL